MKNTAVLACSLLLLSGCSDTPDQAAAPAAPAPAVKPAAAPAPPTESKHLEILSVLSVEHEVDVLAQRAGVVVALDYDQGAEAGKGAVLGRIDDRELMAQIDRARADLTVAESNVRYNEAELRAREAAHTRAKEMRKLGLNSDADLEEAEFRAKGAQFDLESARALVDRNRANLRILEFEIEKTRIRAPFTGVVIRRYIRPGQNVLADEKCFRIGQTAPLLVRFLVPETAGPRPQIGTSVALAPAAEGKPSYTAKISQVSPTVDPASGSYEVTAVLDQSANLRPGMAMRVRWPRAAARE